jgi:hypothetical protein
MDEDEDTGGLASGEGINALMTPGLTVPMALQGVQKAEGVQRQQMQANLDLLNAARAELRSKRVGPSDAEKWFAIASALGQPTRTGSFGETVGNLGTLLSKYSGEKRAAEEERALKERELEMKAGMGQLQLLQDDTRSARDLFSVVSRDEAARRAANRPGEKERLIARALSLPEDSPERKLILASITGTPENIAAAGARAAAIQATKPPPNSANRATGVGQTAPYMYRGTEYALGESDRPGRVGGGGS